MRVSSTRPFQYLESQRLLANTKYGFRRKRSTLDCLIAQYQELVEFSPQGHDIRLLSFGISKSFDRVWHKGLLYKLKSYRLNKLLQLLVAVLWGHLSAVVRSRKLAPRHLPSQHWSGLEAIRQAFRCSVMAWPITQLNDSGEHTLVTHQFWW
jgi:hypothetical protein